MFKSFVIKFTSPFHISDKREEYVSSERFIRSDTLFAAIQEALQKDISEMNEFTVSSLFPCYQINTSERIYFFPLPKLPLTSIYSNIENTSIKTIKKIKWIDHILFEKILQGQRINLNDDAFIQKKEYLISNELKNKMNTSELSPYLISEIIPRVQIPRYPNKKHTSDPFYFEKIYLNVSPKNNPNEGWRMFFLVHGDDTDLKKGLEVLKNTGIGSDKSLGYGNFDYYEIENLNLDFAINNTNCFMNLSLLLPEQHEDIDFESSLFTLIKRGGYITTFPYYSYRKKPIIMIEESSIITFKKKPYSSYSYGKIVDVTPQQTPIPLSHNIYRSGKSILLPIKF